MKYRISTEPTFSVSIYVAGPAALARSVCAEFCLKVGLCVTVTETDFIYTGGCEKGVCVGLVNYPRFPASQEAITHKAMDLAHKLVEGLFQHSVLVVTPNGTTWITRREEGAE